MIRINSIETIVRGDVRKINGYATPGLKPTSKPGFTCWWDLAGNMMIKDRLIQQQ